MPPLLQRLMANKHTSGAGLVYVICMAITKIGAIWFPEHSAQLSQTLDVVKEAAIGYGFLMAGDSGKQQPPTADDPPASDPMSRGKVISLLIWGGGGIRCPSRLNLNNKIPIPKMKTLKYKFTSKILTTAFWLACALPVMAQVSTNALPPNPFLSGSLPPLNTNTTVFANGKLEVRIATVQQGLSGSSYESQAAVSYFFTTNLAVCGDVVNGGFNALDAIHIGIEFVYPVGGVRLGAFAMAGRDYVGNTWEGKIGVRISYVPLTTMAPNTFLFAEDYLLVDGNTNFKGSQTENLAAGIGYRF